MLDSLKYIKYGLALALTVGAVLVLAPAGTPVKHYPNREPVYFWHMWSGEWEPIVEQICRRFNESQTQYEVVPLQVPSEGAETKFLLSSAGGSCPDVVCQWNPVLAMWSERGLLRPLDELLTPADRERFLREAYPIILKNSIYKGKIMGLVGSVDLAAVYYRLDHLKQIGIDENHLPKTLEDLVALGRKLDRYDNSGRLQRIGFLPTGLMAYTPSFGGSFNGPRGIALDTPEQLRALNFIATRIQQLGPDNVTRFLASQAADTGMTQPLITGNYSMLLDGQWRVKQTAQYAPDLKYAITPLPPPAGGKPMASMTAANYMLVPRAAHNPAGAMAFLRFWCGMDDREAGARNVADMGWLPYSKKVTDSPTYQAYLKKYPAYQTFVEIMASPNLETAPMGPLQSFVMSEMPKVDDAVNHGAKTPSEALADLKSRFLKEQERQARLGRGP